MLTEFELDKFCALVLLLLTIILSHPFLSILLRVDWNFDRLTGLVVFSFPLLEYKDWLKEGCFCFCFCFASKS